MEAIVAGMDRVHDRIVKSVEQYQLQLGFVDLMWRRPLVQPKVYEH